MRGLGTLINTSTVIVGSSIGYFIGHRIRESIRTIVVQVIGLATVIMGISNAMDTHNLVFPLVGMVIGLHGAVAVAEHDARTQAVTQPPRHLGAQHRVVQAVEPPALRQHQGLLRAVAEVLETQFSLPVKLKWPNDIYLADKKLAGMCISEIVKYGLINLRAVKGGHEYPKLYELA